MSHVSMNVVLGFTSQELENGRVVPALAVTDVQFDIPKDHVDLKIHGNVIAKIADAFKVFFTSTIREEIIKTAKSTLFNEMPATINPMIAKTNGTFEA